MSFLSKKDKIIFGIYTAIMLGIYITFLILDISNDFHMDMPSIWIKFVSIIATTTFTLYLFIDSIIQKEDLLVRGFGLLASILTLVSDVFLLLLNDHYMAGIIVFSIAHMATGARICLSCPNKRLFALSLSFRILALIAAFIFLSISETADQKIVSLAVFYITNLIMNFVISLEQSIIISRLNRILLTIGLFLFIMCDVFVGLAFIWQDKPLYYVMSWLFYLPCQYLIAISLKRKTDQCCIK